MCCICVCMRLLVHFIGISHLHALWQLKGDKRIVAFCQIDSQGRHTSTSTQHAQRFLSYLLAVPERYTYGKLLEREVLFNA